MVKAIVDDRSRLISWDRKLFVINIRTWRKITNTMTLKRVAPAREISAAERLTALNIIRRIMTDWNIDI